MRQRGAVARFSPLGLCLAVGLLAPWAAAASEAPQHPARETRLVTAGAVRGLLLLPQADPPRGLVLLLPDSLGPDPRSEPYVDQLLRVGFGVLDVLGGGSDPEALEEGMPALQRVAGASGLPVAAIGFGAGARVGLRLELSARVLLYPGCGGMAGTSLSQGAPILLLHGAADPVNRPQDCAALAATLGREGPVRHIAYRDAGYAWDYPAYGIGWRALLPQPGGQGKVVAEAWPELAAMSAAQAADFLAGSMASAAP